MTKILRLPPATVPPSWVRGKIARQQFTALARRVAALRRINAADTMFLGMTCLVFKRLHAARKIAQRKGHVPKPIHKIIRTLEAQYRQGCRTLGLTKGEE